ncbi:F-box protein At3g07870-like [Amaranthus tricolor]|uniref:F-box protein At3g07870-like n=1 Tax=Amaranthus tricolor TaxID=29722 RepID=UPI002588CEA1|nr:F-box protein At3g07870-like [Amaranthus tricolor]
MMMQRCSSRLKSRRRSKEEYNFSDDILIEILKRLPIKSLVRCSLVCKSWFTLLTSNAFISTHVEFNAQNLYLFKDSTYIRHDNVFTHFQIYDGKIVSNMFETGYMRSPFSRKHFLVSSLNGLLCLFDFYSPNPRISPLILWNPSIFKAIAVSVPDLGDVSFTSGGFPKLIFGLGFYSYSNNYKNDYMIIRVAYSNSGTGDLICTNFRVGLYSINKGEWKSLEMKSFPHYITTIRWRGLYLNGVIHWICNVGVNRDGCDEIYRLILTFNLEDESFGEIELPKEVVDVTNQTLRVVMVPLDGKEVLGVVHVKVVFNLWVMKSYGEKNSWVNLFNINFDSGIMNDMNVAILDDHVVVKTYGGWISYDRKKKEMCNLNKIRPCCDYVDTLVANLILIGPRKGIFPSLIVHQRDQIARPSGRRGRRGRGRARAM